MQRRKFSREYKLEAVRLVRERSVSVAQAARDLDVHENVLRKWVKEYGSDPVQAFLGHGQMRPEQLEIERLLFCIPRGSSPPFSAKNVHSGRIRVSATIFPPHSLKKSQRMQNPSQ
jgi:transposase